MRSESSRILKLDYPIKEKVVFLNSKTIRISSLFPASTDEIWDKLQRLDTLQYITAPLATFKPIDTTGMKWIEGETSTFLLKIFSILPMGIHTIHVIQFNKDTLTVYTNESNKSVPIWNHKITLQTTDDATCCYTDEVELYAGWKTPIVFLWSKFFYKHRQRKWLKLLHTK